MVAAHTIYAQPDTLVTTYLHMIHREQFRPAFVEQDGLLMMQMRQPDLNFYRFMYRAVGEHWCWRDRLIMPDDELRAALAQPGVSVNVLYLQGIPAGYVELKPQAGSTEIAYFGLRPDYFGMGLGKHLLSYGIRKAWDDGANRVWVHTCNLDGPHALTNYQKRGFSVFDVQQQPMPARYL